MQNLLVFRRLNPCSNGIQKYNKNETLKTYHKCLNPCSNGIQKYFYRTASILLLKLVLILVLMEYKNTNAEIGENLEIDSLNPCSNGIQKYSL